MSEIDYANCVIIDLVDIFERVASDRQSWSHIKAENVRQAKFALLAKIKDLQKSNAEMLGAIKSRGDIGDGYCFCPWPSTDQMVLDNNHTSGCQNLVSLIAKAEKANET